MNATAFDGGKVHLLTELAARCGVGKHAPRSQWQTDLGEVTCRRCLRFWLVDQRRVAAVQAETTKGHRQPAALCRAAAMREEL